MTGMHPVSRQRPTKTSDGKGGFTEVLGTAVTVYAHIEIHRDRTEAVIEAWEDVKIEDILTVETATYRVTQVTRTPGGRYKVLELNRQSRPVEP